MESMKMSPMGNNGKNDKTYKVIITIQFVIIVILAILFFTNKSSVDTIVIEKEKAVVENQELQTELDALMAEHEKIKEEYGYLSDQLTGKDSLIAQQAKEIENLINSQADYRRIKRKLDYLRGITQGYVNQIDSLYRVNQQLTNENTNLKTDLETVSKEKEVLSQDKDNLSQKINEAAYMKAYGISASAYSVKSNNKESVTDKAKRTDKIKVCMTVGENALISEGQKDLYIRISRPDNNLILSGSGNSFVYQGRRIVYSAKKVINYAKKSTSVCMEYMIDSNTELPKGTYHVAVLSNDNELGQTSFTLR